MDEGGNVFLNEGDPGVSDTGSNDARAVVLRGLAVY
jgi:hypothetical protein